MWSAPADSKLCFRLTKTGRFNGEYTDKPVSYTHLTLPTICSV